MFKKKKTWMWVVAIVIGVLILGGVGVYFWKARTGAKIVVVNDEKILPDSDKVLLYKDTNNNFQLVTAKVCNGTFVVQGVANTFANEKADLALGVFLTRSNDWPKNSVWYYYSVYTKESYDALVKKDEAVPDFNFNLSSGKVLTRWSPQDGPTDINDCMVTAEKF